MIYSSHVVHISTSCLVGTYYVYFNPCGIVNDVDGAQYGASAWGVYPAFSYTHELTFPSQDNMITTTFINEQEPAQGIMQMFHGNTTWGAPCQWGNQNKRTSITQPQHNRCINNITITPSHSSRLTFIHEHIQ